MKQTVSKILIWASATSRFTEDYTTTPCWVKDENKPPISEIKAYTAEDYEEATTLFLSDTKIGHFDDQTHNEDVIILHGIADEKRMEKSYRFQNPTILTTGRKPANKKTSIRSRWHHLKHSCNLMV